MSESTFSQRYASADSNTAGAFAFDTISAKDYAVSKLAFGAVGSVTYVSSADPLPVTISGVATAANQATGNGLLTTIDADTGNIATSAASIDTKTPALGQALAAGSVPVVLPAAQITTLTPPAAITGFALESGGNLAAAATDLAAIEVLLTTIEGNQLADGHNVTIANASIPVTGTFWQATQPVSAASLPLPSGASTLAEQQSQTTHLATIAGDTTAIETAVQLIDDTVATLGTTTYAEATTKGLIIGAIRRDADTTLVDTTNEVGPLQMNSAGQLKVEVFSGETLPVSLASTTITGTVAVTQSGTWTVQPGNTANTTAWLVTGTGGTFPVTDSGGSLTVDAPVGTPVFVRLSDGSAAISTLPVSLASVPSHAVTNAGTFAVQATQSGTWSVRAQDGSGNALTSATRGSERALSVQIVDGSGTQITSFGGSGGGTQYAEGDTAATITGTAILWEGAADTLTTVSAATPLPVTAVNAGTFAVQVDAALPAGTNAIGKLAANSGVTIGAVEIAATQTLATVTTVTTLTGGGVAHDSADSGNPHKIGAKASTSLSGLTLVANADRTDLLAGVDGVQITRNHTNLEDIVVGNASNTDGASTEVIAAAGSGIKQYLTSVTLTNMSATGIYVEMKSGTTVRWRFPVPANSGVTHRFDPPLPPNAANEAWNFDPSAAATTIYCSAMGFKSKV